MGYTDIFVIPVRKEQAAKYREIAELSADVWREHGALSYLEVEADDVKSGKWTSFPQSVDLKPDERVVVALITYRSRAHRDEVNGKAMADPRIASMDPKTLPFDAKRMFWGGFKDLVGSTAVARPAQLAVQPYVFFRGRCREAIAYYEKALGAETVMLMRFSDNPDKPADVPAEMADRVMHASIKIAGRELMMSDGMRSGPLDFACISLSLMVDSEAEAKRLFDALAADGKVEMPMMTTFFSPLFGGVQDKFGVTWMIGVEPSGEPAALEKAA